MSNKVLTPAEHKNLRDLVELIFSLMDADEEGQLVDLYEPALVAAEILGVELD